MRCLAVALLVCVLGSSPAAAATWYVDQAAAAGGDGSQTKPFRKINDARAVLKTGDTVLIRNGTYQESVNFWHLPAGSGGRTTIQAAPGHQPVIDGGGASYVLQAGATPDMTFQGLTVRNGEVGFSFYTASAGGAPNANGGRVLSCKTESISGRGVEFYLSSFGLVEGSDLQGGVAGKKVDGAVIKGNQIHHASAEGITLHADSKNCKYLGNVVHDNFHVNIYLDSASNMTVDGNLVYETGAPPSDQSGILLADEAYPSLGVTSPRLSNITITNNVIINNYSGIEFWDGAFPGQSAMKNVTIANNTIVNSSLLGIAWAAGPHSGTVVRNNIVANKTGGTYLLIAKSKSGVSLDHNLWFAPTIATPFNWGGGSASDHAGWVTASGQGGGDVMADPQFVGAWAIPATNVKLAAGSPAINKGVVIPGLTTDFEGRARLSDGVFDLGAFEYGAAVVVDGGPRPPDGGSLPVDGGAATRSETGLPGRADVGASGREGSAERGVGASSSSGCGCRVDAAPGRSGPMLGLLFLLPAVWLLGRRGRGRARPRHRRQE